MAKVLSAMRKFLVPLVVVAVLTGGTPIIRASEAAPAAQPFTDIAGHPAEAALTALAALGIFEGQSGPGGPAAPDGLLTRAEFAKLVVTAMGKKNMATALAGLRPNFVDEVPLWAWGYVNVAAYMGILRGYEDGTVRAGNTVSYGEAAAMLVRAVRGHAAQVGPGLWPYNYIFYAVDKGFIGNVDVSFAALPCTRGDMARMVLATMQIHQLDAKGATVQDSAMLYNRVTVPEGEAKTLGAYGQHYGNLYQGLFWSEPYLWTAHCAGQTGQGGNGYLNGDADISVIYPQESAAFPLELSDTFYLVGATDLESLNWLEVMVITNDAGEVVFIQVLQDADLIVGVFDEFVDADNDEMWDGLKLDSGQIVKLPEVEWYYEPFGTGAELASLDPEDYWYGLLPGDGFVPTLLNRSLCDLRVLDLFELIERIFGPDTECFEDFSLPYLPAELAIRVDEQGYAISAVATVFTKATWIEEFSPSRVASDGEEEDTEVDGYTAYWWWRLFMPVDFTVPEDCAVTINGSIADRDDLAEYDAISVAFKTPWLSEVWWDFWWDTAANGAMSLDQPDSLDTLYDPECWWDDTTPFVIRAHREVVEGEVYTTSTTYPGAVHRATLDLAGGGRNTYTINESGGIGFGGIDEDDWDFDEGDCDFDDRGWALPAIGAHVRYGLDFSGDIFVPIGYRADTPYALCTGYIIDSSRGESPWLGVFDIRGQEVTYPLDESMLMDVGEPEWVGKFVRLYLRGGQVIMEESDEIDVCGWTVTVLALDAANGTMTLRDGDGDIWFVTEDDKKYEGFVVYDWDPETEEYSYLGLENLEAGDRLLTSDDGPVFVRIPEKDDD